MIVLPLHDESGKAIEARFEVHSGELILRRGGRVSDFSGAGGAGGAGGAELGVVLRLLLQRVDAAELTLASAWVGGGGHPKLANERRQILLPGDGEAVLASGLAGRGETPR